MSVDVIVAYAVGEQSQENGWAKLCTIVANEADVPTVLKNAETAYKEKFDKPLPSAYRSAKSAALKAIKLGVRLLDESGLPKGKSAVEKECKALTEKKVVNDGDIVIKAVAAINGALDRMDSGSYTAYLMYVKTNLKGL